jgi:hypothetical protein
MRFATLAAALALITAPALAQTQSTTPTAAPSTSAAPASPEAGTSTSGTGSTSHSGSHASLDKRFKDANTTNDGHLTKEQAQAAGNLKNVVKHFDAIDADHKGYVTIDDIHKYNHDRRAARKAAKQQKTEG